MVNTDELDYFTNCDGCGFLQEGSTTMITCVCRYSTMAALSSFVYGPFYVVAIYAFITEKEWIRVPGG